MNHIRRIRRVAAALAGLAGAWLGLAAAAPAAFALRLPPKGGEGGLTGVTPPPGPPGWNKHPPLPSRGYLHYAAPHGVIPVPGHAVVIGGMPGWQITLIAAVAALLAGVVAVLAYRAWIARRKPAAATGDTIPPAPRRPAHSGT